MNSATSTHDPSSQTTIIAAGHNEKCQLYNCQLAREIVSNSDTGMNILPQKLKITNSNMKQITSY